MMKIFNISKFKCEFCSEWFNTTTRLPLRLACGHNVCHYCISETHPNHSSLKIVCPVDLQVNVYKSSKDIAIDKVTKEVLERILQQNNEIELSNQCNNQMSVIHEYSRIFDELTVRVKGQTSKLIGLIDQIYSDEIQRIQNIWKRVKIQLNRPIQIIEDWRESVKGQLVETRDTRKSNLIQVQYFIQEARKVHLQINEFLNSTPQHVLEADLLSNRRKCFDNCFTFVGDSNSGYGSKDNNRREAMGRALQERIEEMKNKCYQNKREERDLAESMMTSQRPSQSKITVSREPSINIINSTGSTQNLSNNNNNSISLKRCEGYLLRKQTGEKPEAMIENFASTSSTKQKSSEPPQTMTIQQFKRKIQECNRRSSLSSLPQSASSAKEALTPNYQHKSPDQEERLSKYLQPSPEQDRQLSAFNSVSTLRSSLRGGSLLNKNQNLNNKISESVRNSGIWTGESTTSNSDKLCSVFELSKSGSLIEKSLSLMGRNVFGSNNQQITLNNVPKINSNTTSLLSSLDENRSGDKRSSSKQNRRTFQKTITRDETIFKQNAQATIRNSSIVNTPQISQTAAKASDILNSPEAKTTINTNSSTTAKNNNRYSNVHQQSQDQVLKEIEELNQQMLISTQNDMPGDSDEDTIHTQKIVYKEPTQELRDRISKVIHPTRRLINFTSQASSSGHAKSNSEYQIIRKNLYDAEAEKLNYALKIRILKVQEAIMSTVVYNNYIELMNHPMDQVDFRCYLEMQEWTDRLEILKFVKTSLQDEQFNILLNFLLNAPSVHTIVVSNNQLTEESVEMLVRFLKETEKNSLGKGLKNVYLSKNCINLIKVKNKVSQLKATGINIYI